MGEFEALALQLAAGLREDRPEHAADAVFQAVGMVVSALQRAADAQERTAAAFERIAALLESEDAVGGGVEL